MEAPGKVNCMGAFQHNPRGNIWMNNDSTLGHKLLAKMGWKKGKGLGKHEDGITECLKVRCKSTNSGLGWKEKPIFKTQSIEYDSLLKSLSQQGSPDKSRGNFSLVVRNQMLGNRFGYHKVLKQKDITRYSETDMKSIFMTNPQPAPKKENNKKMKEENLSDSSFHTESLGLSEKSDDIKDVETELCEKLGPLHCLTDNSPSKFNKSSKRSKSKACASEPVEKKKKLVSNSRDEEVNTFSLESASSVQIENIPTEPLNSSNPPSEPIISFDLDEQTYHEINSYVDPWVDSQKLALKMELYKNVLTCLKDHKILQTSNLSSIKGYGNTIKSDT